MDGHFNGNPEALIGQNKGMNHHTEESDGIAQLTAPLSSRFCVQIVQTLDDVSITNFTVTKVTLETGAPGGRGTGVHMMTGCATC